MLGKVGSILTGKLSPRQKAFVEAYLIEPNATKAALTAGFSARGVGAATRGAELVKNRKVKAAIAAAMDRRAKRTEVTADRVVQELALIGFSNIKNYVTWDADGVHLKDEKEIDRLHAAAIGEMTSTTTPEGVTTVKFKLHDKLAALHKLALHTGVIAKGDAAPSATGMTLAILQQIVIEGERAA